MKKYALKSDPDFVVSIVEMEEDTVVDSFQWGQILVTAGNMVAYPESDKDGPFGITPKDLGLRWEELEEED